MSEYAPAREDGLFPYVVSMSSWGRTWDRIEWAESIGVARREHGWTREMHTSVKVRRARVDDMQSAQS